LPTGGAAARLARIKDGSGAAFFAPPEIAAAARLETDFQAGQEGLVRGSDWLAPPRSGAPRAGGAEASKTNAMDARARFSEAMGALTPAAAYIVRAVLVEQSGMEAVERRAGWPARSAKVALKFALQELAAIYRGGGREKWGTSAKG
jgi:DNA-directed RNA polymerase specialized sigma24 family protein